MGFRRETLDFAEWQSTPDNPCGNVYKKCMDFITHRENTWKHLIRKQRSEVALPLVPFEFLAIEGDIVRYDKQKFHDFCDAAGASVHRELEMLGSPVLVDNVEFTKRWQKRYDKYLLQLSISYNETARLVYYPLNQLVWTPHRSLLRRKSKPILTTYGHQRLNEIRHSKIFAWGEMKSASAWSRDTRARVSDKTIKARINNGWKPEAAISTPRG